MKTIAKLAFVTTILAAPFSLYATTHSEAPATASASADKITDGEIRKIDKDAKKITIKHSELKHLEMPAMTMVFQVKDPSLLDKVKQGDKVSFVAEKEGGQFIVTQIDAKQ
jgi:Cu(I)/Ag(I) efflux system protein CusF